LVVTTTSRGSWRHAEDVERLALQRLGELVGPPPRSRAPERAQDQEESIVRRHSSSVDSVGLVGSVGSRYGLSCVFLRFLATRRDHPTARSRDQENAPNASSEQEVIVEC
jgi:hypothetical protein